VLVDVARIAAVAARTRQADRGRRNVRPTQPQEDEVSQTIIVLGPDQDVVVTRDPILGGRQMSVQLAWDGQGRAAVDAGRQQVRAARHRAATKDTPSSWERLVNPADANPRDPFQFWMGVAGEGAPFTVPTQNGTDKLAIRNLHPSWRLTVTSTVV
jgi:hypothetical protein